MSRIADLAKMNVLGALFGAVGGFPSFISFVSKELCPMS